MARAKRTDRAEARRRYRAEMAGVRGGRRDHRRRRRVERRRRQAAPAVEQPAVREPVRPDRHGRRVPPVDPPGQPARGPRGAPVAGRPHEGALAPGRSSRSSVPSHSRSPPARTSSPSSCSPTSCRRPRSAASSSRASWRRGPAGCSAPSSARSPPIAYSAGRSPYVAARRPSDAGARPRRDRSPSVFLLAGHGRALRRRGRLVSPVPASSRTRTAGRRAEAKKTGQRRPDPRAGGASKPHRARRR